MADECFESVQIAEGARFYMKYNITGNIMTPIACVFRIFAYDAIIPIGVEIRNIMSPNQPVNKIVMADRPAKTPAHNFE